jgi:hypothetical protein
MPGPPVAGRRLHSRVSALVLLVAVSLIAIGCYAGDYEFQVHNATDQTWWLRVAIGGDWGDDQFWVSRVKPGADGVVFDWYGARDKTVEVLDQDCSVVAVLAPDAGGTYRAAEVPGITGIATAIGRTWPGPNPSPNDLITADGRCNGTILM